MTPKVLFKYQHREETEENKIMKKSCFLLKKVGYNPTI